MPTLNQFIANGQHETAVEALLGLENYETDDKFQSMVTLLSSRMQAALEDEIEATKTEKELDMERRAIAKMVMGIAGKFRISKVDFPGALKTARKPTVTEPERKTEQPKVVFLAASPKDMAKLRLKEEYFQIQMELDDKASNFKLLSRFESRNDTLIRTLMEDKPTYVHFAGHGVPETEGFYPAGVVLEDRYGQATVVSGESLANMFRLIKKRSPLKLVFLNACETMEQARAISAHDLYVIGMGEKIPDKLSIALAGGFYLGLAETPDDIPYAFEIAMATIDIGGLEGAAIPRLFYGGEEVVF